MAKKYGMVIQGFDPNTNADHIAKFGLAVRDHDGPEEFKKRHRIRERTGST